MAASSYERPSDKTFIPERVNGAGPCSLAKARSLKPADKKPSVAGGQQKRMTVASALCIMLKIIFF